MNRLIEIEEKEKEILFKLGWLFKNSLDEFSTSIDKSLMYLDKIVIPIVMASKEDKSYNPFSEIIEKYVIHILIKKFEKEGYNLLPLGYSADLTIENDNHILSIDIKTANIENPSDFNRTINVGINQMTHITKMRLCNEFLPPPYYVYPTIPPFYELNNGIKKLILTYGLMFIYPTYKDLIDEIRNDYYNLFRFFNKKLKEVLIPIIERNFKINREKALEIVEKKQEKSRYSRDQLMAESLIRGVFVHRVEKENILNSLNITNEERSYIEEFSRKIENFIQKLKEREIKPIAIIAISLPNGLLKDKYTDKFVSGKDYAKSARYHYEDGIYDIIREETGKTYPRVIFLDINRDYVDKIKSFFGSIRILDYKLKTL